MNDKLTVAYIVGDDIAQDDIFRESVEQASSIANTLVVIDSSTTAETRKLCTDILADSKVEHLCYRHVPWQSDYALQRNIMLSKCRTEWVMVLDSDEMLEDTFDEEFKQVSQGNQNAFLLPRYNFVMRDGTMKAAAGHESMLKYPDHQCRLLRVMPGLRYKGIIHEQPGRAIVNVKDGNGKVTARLWWPEGEVGVMKTHILHYGWCRNDDWMKQKMQMRSALEQHAVQLRDQSADIIETPADISGVANEFLEVEFGIPESVAKYVR